jgi:hypothetical protein
MPEGKRYSARGGRGRRITKYSVRSRQGFGATTTADDKLSAPTIRHPFQITDDVEVSVTDERVVIESLEFGPRPGSPSEKRRPLAHRTATLSGRYPVAGAGKPTTGGGFSLLPLVARGLALRGTILLYRLLLRIYRAHPPTAEQPPSPASSEQPVHDEGVEIVADARELSATKTAPDVLAQPKAAAEDVPGCEAAAENVPVPEIGHSLMRPGVLFTLLGPVFVGVFAVAMTGFFSWVFYGVSFLNPGLSAVLAFVSFGLVVTWTSAIWSAVKR